MWGRRNPPPAGRRQPARGRLSAAQRLAICKPCPYRTRDNRCSSCGCFIKAKVRVPSEKCPNGKW